MSAAQISRAIQDALPGQPERIAGVNWTRRKNLVIHTVVPFSANKLQTLSNNFIPPLCSLLGTSERPLVELDEVWSSVVLQHVPGNALRNVISGLEIQTLREEIVKHNGILEEDVKGVRVLCAKEELRRKDYHSVHLMVSNEQTATRLLRSGIFVYSAFCRVVQYRKRKKVTSSQI